jgi:hypothetical protein
MSRFLVVSLFRVDGLLPSYVILPAGQDGQHDTRMDTVLPSTRLGETTRFFLSVILSEAKPALGLQCTSIRVEPNCKVTYCRV